MDLSDLQDLRKHEAKSGFVCSVNVNIAAMAEWSSQQRAKRDRVGLIVKRELAGSWAQMKAKYQQLKKTEVAPEVKRRNMQEFLAIVDGLPAPEPFEAKHAELSESQQAPKLTLATDFAEPADHDMRYQDYNPNYINKQIVAEHDHINYVSMFNELPGPKRESALGDDPPSDREQVPIVVINPEQEAKEIE